jgi:hypothetical protein
MTGGGTMKDQIEARLTLLREQFKLGQGQLREVEIQRVDLEQTLTRISGAIQVLEELLGDNEAHSKDGSVPAEGVVGSR